MTTYGLTSTGPRRKTATEIRESIVDFIQSIPGLGEVRTSTGSSMGNRIDAFVDELAQVWEGWEASVLAFSKDGASGQSLDDRFAYVGKFRLLAEYSTVELTLWTYAVTPVAVPAENIVKQLSTGVQFETLEDVEIPAADNLVEDIDIGDIEFVTGNTVRYAVHADTDLSGVTEGDLLIVTGSTNSANDGAFPITAIDNVAPKSVDVTNMKRSDDTADEAASDALGIITDGIVTVQAQSVTTGQYTASPHSITLIDTPVTDWEGVVNLDDAVEGRNTQSDAEFRRRASAELRIAQGGTAEAVRERLQDLDDVTYVSVAENDSDVEVDGLKPNSIFCTVVGGDDQEIVNTIGRYKPAGSATNGDESGTYTNSSGYPKTIYYGRVTEVNPYYIVNLTVTADYPADGDDLIKAALVAIEFEAGDDVLNYKMAGAIYAANIPGITELEVLQGLSASPTLTDPLTITPTQVAVNVADRITVVS